MSATSSFVIAIAGASGSGKSTLATALLSALNATEPAQAVALPIDAYYRDLSHKTFEERDRENFDHPDALELDLFARHLGQLKQGQPVDAPVYDFSTHTRTNNFQRIEAAPIIIVEGILALADDSPESLYDFSVFVEAPLDLCLARRIERDRVSRGRDEASVRSFWFERVLPMYLEFGEVARARAQLTVDGTAPTAEGVSAIQATLNTTQHG